jgi:hypothetical protein
MKVNNVYQKARWLKAGPTRDQKSKASRNQKSKATGDGDNKFEGSSDWHSSQHRTWAAFITNGFSQLQFDNTSFEVDPRSWRRRPRVIAEGQPKRNKTRWSGIPGVGEEDLASLPRGKSNETKRIRRNKAIGKKHKVKAWKQLPIGRMNPTAGRAAR